MTQASNRFFTPEVCLEARIAAPDPVAARASIERWLQGRGGGAHGRRIGRDGATFSLRAGAEGTLSVFLRAWGEDAPGILARHGSDLVGALAEVRNGVALTWVRHQPALRLAAASSR